MPGSGIKEQTRRVPGWRKERRWERGGLSLSATGDRGQAAISVTWCCQHGFLFLSVSSSCLHHGSGPVMPASSVSLVLSSQMAWWHWLYSEQLLQPSCTILHSGPVPQQVTVPTEINKGDLHPPHCTSLQFFSYFLFLFILSVGTFASLKTLNLKVLM